MTIEELCKKYNLSKNTVSANFKRTQDRIKNNYGVLIEKHGRGQNATYEEIDLYPHAKTMSEEEFSSAILDRQNLKYQTWEFHLLLAIIITPFHVFRGTYKDLLKYMEIKDTAANIELLKKAISFLEENQIAHVFYDNTGSRDTVITLSLLCRVEEQMRIGIDMVEECKKIAEKNNKKSFIPLLKTWLAIQIAEQSQPFTMKELSELTDMSEYQLRQNKKLLERSNIFGTKKIYADKEVCLGQNVDLNGFFESNRCGS